MIPFANEVITLFHKGQGGITRHVINGCSYRRRAVRDASGGVLVITTEAVCRIPYDAQAPAAGDVIIPGNVNASPNGSIALTELYQANVDAGAFIVQSVSDNGRNGLMPHWAARGA